MNGTIRQEGATKSGWTKTSPAAFRWPAPVPVAVAAGTASATISQSQVSISAAAGSHLLFLSGSRDIVSRSPGTDTVTDRGDGKADILPAAGRGTVIFAGNAFNIADTLDTKTARAATKWIRSAATLSNFLALTDSAVDAALSVPTAGGGSGVATGMIQVRARLP